MKKYIYIYQNVSNEAIWRKVTWRFLVLFFQLFCKSELTSKLNSYIKNKNPHIYKHELVRRQNRRQDLFTQTGTQPRPNKKYLKPYEKN